MRYLPISIFILTLILSCSLPLTKGLLEITPENKHVVNRYFSNTKMDYIYKTKFQILEHTFGGILIVKKIGEDYHRVVLTTEFGNKIFDFDFKENDFKVNYILDDLNKNFIINMLRSDFQLLISQNIEVDRQFVNDLENIYESHVTKDQNIYVFSKKKEQLTKIINASKTKEKLTIYFKEVKDNIALNVEMNRNKFNMIIKMNYIGD